MIKFKAVAVLLAVSAMAALVQSSDNEGDKPQGNAEWARCRDFVAQRLAELDIDDKLKRLLNKSRSHYSRRRTYVNSLEILRKGIPARRYPRSMRAYRYPEACTNFIDQIYKKENLECGEYIQINNVDSKFLIDVARYSMSAQVRIEIFYACFYAGSVKLQTGPNAPGAR